MIDSNIKKLFLGSFLILFIFVVLHLLGYTFYKISRFGIKDYEVIDQEKKANVVCIHKTKNNLVKVFDRKLKTSGFTPMIKGINPLKF